MKPVWYKLFCHMPSEQVSSVGTLLMDAELVRARWLEWAKTGALCWVLLGLSIVGILGLMDCMVSNPNQRGWVIIGLMYYLGTIWNRACESLKDILWKKRYIRVVIDRTASHTLFEAITKRFESLAEQSGAFFSSRDVEAFTPYDPTTGMRVVQFSFWGTQPRQLTFHLKPDSGMQQGRSVCVTVDYNLGDNVICGRDSHLERIRNLVLWIKTSPELVAQDKVLFQRWCLECVNLAMEPPRDRVEVYGLQESSSDWVPEWKLERTRSSKGLANVGDRFYLERSVFEQVLADARIWAHHSLRLYMVTGPPGVGKTEFTVWLAGRLRLPIYRLSLTSGSLTDARLAQLLSQSSMLHEMVVVQVDEFQQVMRRWDDPDSSFNVTPGGLNEVLQGSTTLAKGIIVLTGTCEVANDDRQKKYGGLFRRFPFQIRLGYLDDCEAGRFFHGFLKQFVDNSDKEWQIWESQFVASLKKYAFGEISIDMIKQYLMRQITVASAAGVLQARPGTDEFYTLPNHKNKLLTILLSKSTMKSFLQVHSVAHLKEL